MKTRKLTAAAAALAMVFATACAPVSGETTVAEPASTIAPPEPPPGFYLSGEFVAIEEFDPDDDYELINPCGEIPGEVFAEAGLSLENGSTQEELGRLSCALHPIDSESTPGLFLFFADDLTEDMFAAEGTLISASLSSNVPGAYVHHLGSDAEFSCSASIPTSRGRVAVMYNDYLTSFNQEKFCARALGMLESIYIQLRGNNELADK